MKIAIIGGGISGFVASLKINGDIIEVIATDPYRLSKKTINR